MENMEIVNVVNPEQWEEAASVSENVEIEGPNGVMKFKIRAESFGEDMEFDKSNPEIEVPKQKRGMVMVDNRNDPEYQRKLQERGFRRNIVLIDRCWTKLPGTTVDEKVEWALENIEREGEFYKLAQAIRKLSGDGTGRQEDTEEQNPIMLTNPEDWVKASKAPTFYRFQRAGKILRFEIKGVNGKRIKEIEIATNPGEPPVKFQPTPDGRRGSPMPDPEDANYKKKVEEMKIVEQVMYFDSSLPFVIPGTTIKDKIEWLHKRPVWEVLSLISFIRMENLSYRGKADFFTSL